MNPQDARDIIDGGPDGVPLDEYEEALAVLEAAGWE